MSVPPLSPQQPRHPWGRPWGVSGGEQPRGPPLVTRLVVGLCVVLHVLQIVGEYGNADASLHPQGRRPHGFFSLLQLSRNTLCPVLVWESPLQEWPRLFTSAVFHANLWHLMMNMVSTVALGARLERHHAFGSLWMLCTTISAILLTGVTHILLAFAMYQLTGNQEAWRGHSVGFSAVLFHYLTLECHIENDANHSSNSSATTRSSSSRRSLFGFVDVPSRVYPWALLVALQVTMPNLSLLGHLSGILTGTLQSGRGGRALQAMFAPSFETLARIEQSVLCQRILPLLTRYGYVPVPASAPALYSVISRSSGGGGGCGSTAISAVQIGAGRMGTRCAQGCQAASRAIVGRDDPHDNDHEGSAGTTSVRRLGDEWRRLLARLAHALVHRTRSARRSPEDASLDDEHEQLLLVETTTTSRTAARHRRSEQDGLEAGEGDDEEDDDASEERDVAFV